MTERPTPPPEPADGQDPDATVPHQDNPPDHGTNRRPGGDVR